MQAVREAHESAQHPWLDCRALMMDYWDQFHAFLISTWGPGAAEDYHQSLGDVETNKQTAATADGAGDHKPECKCF